MRRIGVLMTLAAGDPIGQARVATFAQGLQQLGWTVGRNVQLDVRWPGPEADDARRSATELVAAAPDVIVANGNAAVAPLLQATRSVPIVFTIVPDPVGAGFVDSLPRPGGNARNGWSCSKRSRRLLPAWRCSAILRSLPARPYSLPSKRPRRRLAWS